MITGSGGSSVDAFDKRKSILSIREESLGMSEKPDYITIKVNYLLYLFHKLDLTIDVSVGT